MSELISIIIPVYNVENYIDRCLNSVVNQTYENIEIILVNDGSTDSSSDKCNIWKNADSRISVIHKKNGGLSSARNAGLENASGRYILFIDSDDCVSHDICKKLHELITKNNADIAIGSPCKFYDEPPKDFITDDYLKCDKYYALEKISTDYRWVVAWGKLYRKELFTDIRFPFGKLHEDEFIIHELYYKCTNIVQTNDLLYYYFYNESSITGKKFSPKRMDVFEALNNRLSFYKEHQESRFYDLTVLEILQMMVSYSRLMTDPSHKSLLASMREDGKLLLNKHKKACRITLWNFPKIYAFLYPACTTLSVFVRALKKVANKISAK